jgi:hypothetical protein
VDVWTLLDDEPLIMREPAPRGHKPETMPASGLGFLADG